MYWIDRKRPLQVHQSESHYIVCIPFLSVCEGCLCLCFLFAPPFPFVLRDHTRKTENTKSGLKEESKTIYSHISRFAFRNRDQTMPCDIMSMQVKAKTNHALSALLEKIFPFFCFPWWFPDSESISSIASKSYMTSKEKKKHGGKDDGKEIIGVCGPLFRIRAGRGYHRPWL